MTLCTPEAVHGPPADILEGLYIRIDKIALLIPSLSLHWRVGPTRQVFFNLPPKEGSWVRVRV
jgi:hypothetical protein